MSYGERATVEGTLAHLRPRLALEIGRAEGGSLDRIAHYSDEVHSIDLVPPTEKARRFENVHHHTGDSHELLPQLLQSFVEQGRNVDFVLVDGDHSSEGVRRDIDDLLASPAIGDTVILAHDTMNEVVRAGVLSVRYGTYPKVAHVDYDFVPGYLFTRGRIRHELWGGLGLILVDAGRPAYGTPSVYMQNHRDPHRVLRAARRRAVWRERLGAVASRLRSGGSGRATR
jgi:Methyltransferase domain